MILPFSSGWKVGVAVDVNAKLREDLRVLDEADVLIGEIGVVAVGLHRAVGGVLRGVLLKEIDVLVAVGLGEAAEDDVSLRIFLFRIDTGGQLAEGAADELNVNIGVKSSLKMLRNTSWSTSVCVL